MTRWLRWTIAAVAILLVAVAALAAAAWWIAETYGPALARERVESALASALGRPVRLERVALQAWLVRVRLEGLAIAAGPTWDAGNLATVGRIDVSAGVASLWRRELVISRIRVQDADVRITAGAGGDGKPLTLPPAIPERFDLGPLTVAVREVVLERVRLAYLDPDRGRALETKGLSATARPAGGGLDARVDAARVRIRAGAFDETFQDLHAAGRLHGETLALAESSVRWGDASARASGEINQLVASPSLTLRVSAQAPLAPLAARAGAAWPIEGQASLEGTVRGDAAQPVVDATVAVPALRVGPLRASRVSARLAWERGELQATDVAAVALGGSVRGAARLVPGQPDSTRVHARLERVDLREIQTVLERSYGASGQATLEVDLEGDPRAIETARGLVRVESATVALTGEAGRLGPIALGGEASLAGGTLDIARAEASVTDARVEARGPVALDGPRGLHLAATGDLARLATRFGLDGLAGPLAASAEVSGRWDDPAATGAVRATWLEVQGVRLDAVAVPFSLARRSLAIGGATARLGGSEVRASGTLAWTAPALDPARWRQALRVALDLAAPAARLEDAARLVPEGWQGSGAVALAARFEGTPEAWQATGTVEAARVTARVTLEDVRARFAASPAGVRVLDARLAALGVPVAGEGEWQPDGAVRATARLGPAPLAKLPGVPPALAVGGEARGRVALERRGGRLSGTAVVEARGTELAHVALGDGTLDATVDGDALSATLAFPASRITGSASGRLAANGRLDVQVRAADVDVGPLVARLAPAAGVEVDGRLTARADLAVPVADPAAARGAVVVDPVRVAIAGETWQNRSPVLIRRAPGVTYLDRLELASAAGTVSGAGTVQDAGRLDVRLRGRFPLALLPALRPEIRDAAGVLDATLSIGGTVAAPVLNGEGSIADARLTLRDWDDTLRAVSARLTASPSGVRLVSASASVAGGEIRGSGDLALDGTRVRGFRFLLEARDVAPPPVEGFETAWDADLELVGSPARAQLRGEARLLRGTYARDLSLLRLLLERRRAAPPAGAGGLHLDLRVALDDRLVVRTSLARLRADGTLTVQGTTANPVVFGTVTAHDGALIFRRHEFTLTTASVRFTDPRGIDPILDVRGTARIRQYDVSLTLTGRLEDLEIRLASSPPLPEEDVLSLVAFGATRTQLGARGGTAVVGEMVGFIIQDLAGVQPGRVGVDVFEVDTTDSGERSVRVGKQITPRTLIVYSQGIEQTDARKLRIEYQVFGPLMVAGEQDFRGGFGADVLLRVRFR